MRRGNVTVRRHRVRLKLALRMLRRGAASLFVLALPKAALAAEAKLTAFLPSITLPPLASPALANFSGFSALPKEFGWIGSLTFGRRRDLHGRILPPPAWDDRRMNCGKYCVPTFEMSPASVIARSVLFGAGAASIATGLVFALAPESEELGHLAPTFRFCAGRQRVSMTALWSF